MLIRSVPAVLATLFLALPAQAQEDPLKSGACGQALQRLEMARREKSPGTERLRAEATRICLGGAQTATRPARVARSPEHVPPPVIDPPTQPPPVVAVPAAPFPAPVAIDRPATVAGCDMHGCWATDGSRLQRVGPNLAGPQGVCVPQGSVLACP